VLANHKANFGHSEYASGLVALVTTICSLNHNSVAPHVHISQPIFEIDSTPLIQLPVACAVDVGACASVNGTSFSGTNIHLVLHSCDLVKLSLPQLAASEKDARAPTLLHSDCVEETCSASTHLDGQKAAPEELLKKLGKEAEAVITCVTVPPTNSLVSSLLQLPTSERAAQLEAMVLEHAVSVGGQLEVGLDEPLMEAGLNSLAVMRLMKQLSHKLDMKLPATIAFDFPTVSQLAAHIGSLLCWEEPVEARAVQPAVVSQGDVSVQESLMVAGSGCVLPGASNNSAKFWCVLNNAVDPICGVPNGRWVERQYAESSEQVGSSKCYVQCGGFVAGLEGFDNTHFRISASEAKQMDLQQRAVLEVCLVCLNLSGTDCACCV
jgi:acyl carrier protein